MSRVIIIGGGAAGMMASIVAAEKGHKVVLFEKNEKLGKKLFITGKGRCNFTNSGDEDDIRNSVVTNQKFLFSAFKKFSNYDTMSFFDELGLKFKIERGNRVFPESDHSSDVINALSRRMNRLNVEVHLNTAVVDIVEENGSFKGVKVSTLPKEGKGRENGSEPDSEFVQGDVCVLATGGNSYQSTGSTGDGYRWAKKLGHTVTPILPALVPFVTREEWSGRLQGLSLKNISISVMDGDKELYSDFGEMLFTHYGVSGPVVLSASSFVSKIIREKNLKLVIDLKPALSEEQLDDRILRDFEEEKNKDFKNSLDKLLPKKLIPVIIELSEINPDKKVNSVTKEERLKLVYLLKHFTLTLTGLRGFNEAIITQGGINVKEINPTTMESKIVKGLYFAGEVIDVDAVTGGFNLQIAWSTAYAAASHIGE
ncbi:MAG: NAD(P)/FAD-dependent oxidoreductase [Lachnospira sp.]